MAGGTFNPLAGKVRPGTYINFNSARQDTIGISERGVVLIPLFTHSYGPAKEYISISCDAPDASIAKLGFSIYDDDPGMLLIREALKNARTVIVYILNQGSKASVTVGSLTAKARYGGKRGNDLKIVVASNPVGGVDVIVTLKTSVVSQYEGIETIESLIAQNDPWIQFEGNGPLTPTAGANLTGGTNGAPVAGDIVEFLDRSESLHWNTLAFPLDKTGEQGDPAPSLYESVKSKIKYFREEAGKYRKAVVPDFPADYEGIINVTNSVVLNGVKLTKAQATAWVAGVDAGASNTESNTYVKYDGATDIVGAKNHAEAVAAINNGEFFFTFSEEGDVVVEYDINSLRDFSKPKDKTYRKNRVLRVFDTFAESIMLNFPPNKYDNSPTGWDVMEGTGRAILKQFLDAGAIKNVNYYNDFVVDRSRSSGDETYFTIGLQATDSSEKLYFTINTL